MSELIGFISYALDRNPRGIGFYSLHLLEAYQQLGIDPLVLQSGDWPAGFDPSGMRTVNLAGARLLPALLTLGQLQIGWQSQRRRLKLVHDPTGTIPLMLCPTRRVTTIHDTIPFIYPEVSTTLDRLVYQYWLPYVVKHIDTIITVSQKSKLDIIRYLHIPEVKITVVSEAAGMHFRLMKEDEFLPALKRSGVERPYILYVGSVEPRKNLLRLLDAYKLLYEWSPKWRLVIVGARNYWKSSPVAEKVQNLGMQEQVKFTGYIPDEDLPAVYNGADLFCFPSLYEGFGLPVLEAMACGTPVVTSNTSSLPEVAGEAALQVDPYNVPEIAGAMRQVLENPDLAQELRARGLARAAEFSWEKTALQTIAVYEKVLGEKLL